MPYPFLSSLLDSLEATQRSKRVLFQKEPRSEILTHITKQMQDRQEQKDIDKAKKKEQEKKELQQFRQSMMQARLKSMTEGLKRQ